MEEETVAGVVERVVHRRENWGVYDVSSEGATVRVKGNVSFREGEYVRVAAVAEDNERWGRQYVVRSVEKVEGPPPTSRGMSKFLVANTKGIGPGHVSRILETYEPGELIEMLDGDDGVGRLMEVPGIGETRAKQIVETWSAGSLDRRTVIPLVEKFGRHLTYGECRTAATFGGAARRQKFFDDRPWIADPSAATADPLGYLEAEPYDLVDILKPHRRSFEFVDGMIRQTYPEMAEGPARTNAGMAWLAGRARGFCTPAAAFYSRASGLLGVPAEGVVVPSLKLYGGMVYSARLWELEESIVRKLRGIRDGNPEPIGAPTARDAELDADQQRALEMVRGSNLCIINGSAGTGKTTVIRHIADMATATPRKRGIRDDGCESYLLAPTGKAATRVSEKTGRRATTIHKLVYGGNAELLRGTFIVDESSMIDAKIFSRLLGRMDERRCRLVLIGDASQLPPVGRGRIFFDLVECGKIPTTTLTTVHRQREGGILDNAGIINGCPDSRNNTKFCSLLKCDETAEFSFEPDHLTDADRIKRIRELVEESRGDLLTDVQVITPRRSGTDLCAATINETLRHVLNPASPSRDEIRTDGPGKFALGGPGDLLWRVRDKVICTRNQYRSPVLVVANGEQGVVNGAGIEDGRAYVSAHFFLTSRTERFWAPGADGLPTWNDLDLGYCITVHKSQGSEYRTVVLAIGRQTGPMLLTRKLLYTGVTRASERLILIGSREDVSRCMGEPGAEDAETWSCIGEKI